VFAPAGGGAPPPSEGDRDPRRSGDWGNNGFNGRHASNGYGGSNVPPLPAGFATTKLPAAGGGGGGEGGDIMLSYSAVVETTTTVYYEDGRTGQVPLSRGAYGASLHPVDAARASLGPAFVGDDPQGYVFASDGLPGAVAGTQGPWASLLREKTGGVVAIGPAGGGSRGGSGGLGFLMDETVADEESGGGATATATAAGGGKVVETAEGDGPSLEEKNDDDEAAAAPPGDEDPKAKKAREKAEKEAKKAAEKAEKEAKKSAEKAEKEAKKAAEKAEKEAKKAAEKAEKEAAKQEKEEVAQKKKEDEAAAAEQTQLTEGELTNLMFIILDSVAREVAMEDLAGGSNKKDPISTEDGGGSGGSAASEERLRKLESGVQTLLRKERVGPAGGVYSTTASLGWNAPSGAEGQTASILDTIDAQQKLQLAQARTFQEQTEALLGLVKETLTEQRATWAAQRLLAQKETDVQRREVELQAAALRRRQADSVRQSLNDDARDAVRDAMVRLSGEMEAALAVEGATGAAAGGGGASGGGRVLGGAQGEVETTFKSNWGRMLHSGANWGQASVELQRARGGVDGDIDFAATGASSASSASSARGEQQQQQQQPRIFLRKAPPQGATHSLSAEELRWHALFEQMDRKHDGSLTRADFVQAIRSSPALAKELHDLLGLPEHIRQEDGSRDVRFISCLFLFIIFFALCDRHFCSCN
jgi:outer membrane biosynthesis protein TonB